MCVCVSVCVCVQVCVHFTNLLIINGQSVEIDFKVTFLSLFTFSFGIIRL